MTIETADLEVGDNRRVEHAGLKPGSYVTLEVTDTGVGMDEATQARIFEPFFTTKEPGSGTGLGLATVFGIVQQSGGIISTTSQPGCGATFKISLPRTTTDVGADGPAGSPRPRSTSSLRGGETILVVEDDDAVRAMIRAVLEKDGHRVIEASNGSDALLMCEKLQDALDLVITDVVMPRMSGREFVSKLEVLRPDLTVLYMSGYTDGTIVHHGILEPGIAFLQKPVVPQVLVQQVRDLLSQKARAAP